MIYKDFYSELGKLLYAIADIDRVITEEEKKELQALVRKKLVPTEKSLDEFGTDSAYYAEFEFDVMDDQILEPYAAFDSFLDFVEDHQTAFTQELKDTCIEVAERLANAYRGTNKKEALLINELKDKLGKIKVKRKKV